MGNAAVKAAEAAGPEQLQLPAVPESLRINHNPERAFAVPPVDAGAMRPSERGAAGAATVSEELLVELWQRRAAVEQSLRVASELFAEAEAAALQLRGGAAPSVEALRARWEAAAPRRAALGPKERDDVVAHLLELRAALAESDLQVYAAHAAAWSDLIATNPLLALASAATAQHERSAPSHGSPPPRRGVGGATSPPAGDALSPAGQSIRSGRRYMYSGMPPSRGASASQPVGAAADSPGLTRAQALLRTVALEHSVRADKPASEAAQQAEVALLRDDLARCRRRCAELATAEREAREEAVALAAALQSGPDAQQLDAMDGPLDSALSAAEALRRQWAAHDDTLAARLGAVRKQASTLRDVTEAARWDIAGASEAVAREAMGMLAAAEAQVHASHTILQAALPAEADGDQPEEEAPGVRELRAALEAAQRRCAELAGAAALGQAAAETLRMTETQLAAAAARANNAEAQALALQQSQAFAEEALRATQVQRNALAEQLADAQRRLQAAAPPAKSNTAPAALSPSEADWLSEAGFSDASSAFGGDVDALSAQRVRKQREEARARAAANKARFEAIKAERNALRMHARTAAADLDAMRQEAARVVELKEQLLALQKTFFV